MISVSVGMIGVRLGSGVLVGPSAVVSGVEVPDGKLVPPGARVTSAEEVAGLPDCGEAERKFMDEVVETNIALAGGYLGKG